MPGAVEADARAAAGPQADSAAAAAAAAPSGRVFVGGFLALYDEVPDDARLRLSRDEVARHLPSVATSLPLNVNHDSRATIGRVYELFNVPPGLFCFGEIYSPSFLEIVGRSAEYSQLVHSGPAGDLPRDPVVEYLSTGFPSLSLSNVAGEPAACASVRGAEPALSAARESDESRVEPEVGAEAETEAEAAGRDVEGFFRHVAICGVGRRRGTLAVYGRDPAWIVGRFRRTLSDEGCADVTRRVLETLRGGGQAAVDPFRSDPYGLLATSVDTSYIRERFPKLQYDKHILGLRRGTYIKASERPTACVEEEDGDGRVGGPTGGEEQAIKRAKAEESAEVSTERATGSVDGPPRTTDGASVAVDGDRASMAQQTAAPFAGVAGGTGVAAPVVPLSSDGVYLSKDALLSLLQTVSKAPGVGAAVPSAGYPFPPPIAAGYPAPLTAAYGAPIGLPPAPPPSPTYGAPPGAHLLPPGAPVTLEDGRVGYAPAAAAYPPVPYAPLRDERHLYAPAAPAYMYPPAGRAAYDGRRSMTPVANHGGGGGTRRRRASDRGGSGSGGEEEADEDVSFPGDADYPTSRNHGGKRARRGEGVDVKALGELRDAMQALRQDLNQWRRGREADAEEAARRAAAHGVEAPPSAAPSTSCGAPAAPLGSPAKRTAATVLANVAGGGGGAATVPAKMATGAASGSVRMNALGGGGASAGPSAAVVNASCVPGAQADGAGGPPATVLEMNRRLFVRALNKME